jgi:hypothetical protein
MTAIFLRTPFWVWPLLLALIAAGLRLSRTRSVPPTPVIVISGVMLSVSLLGVISVFHASALALLAWLSLLVLTLIACRQWGYPRGWQYDTHTKRLHVPGSWWPMILFLLIFSLKFAVGMALSLRPQWALQTRFLLPVSALYGLLSGIFAARAWHALRISRPTARSVAD